MKIRKLFLYAVLLIALMGLVLVLYYRFFSVVAIHVRPPKLVATPLMFAPRVSTLTVPISIQSKHIAEFANEACPKTVSGTESIIASAKVKPRVVYRGISSRIEFEEARVEVAQVDWQVHRGPLSIDANDGRIQITAPLTGNAKVSPSGATGNLKGTALGSVSIRITPQYELSADLDIGLKLDKAQILGIGITRLAQSKVNDAAKKAKHKVAEAITKNVNLRSAAAQAWDQIPSVFQIPSIPNCWLVCEPEAVLVSGPFITNSVVSATLSIQARLQTLLQEKRPEVKKRGALPDIQGPVNDNKFSLAVPVVMEVNALNRVFASMFEQNEISVSDNLKILVKNLTLIPNGDRLLVRAEVESSSLSWTHKRHRALLYLSAIPKLDPRTQTLRMTEVAFTAETESALQNTAGWLLSSLLIEKVENFSIDVGAHLKAAGDRAGELSDSIKLQPPLKLSIEVSEIEGKRLAVFGNHLFFEVDVIGEAFVTSNKREE